MSRFISLPALWTLDGAFQNNALVNIDIESRYVATVQKPAKPYPPASQPTLIPVLQVEDPNLGTQFLNVPYSVYQAAIIAASGSNSPLLMTIFATIQAPSFTYSSIFLQNAKLLQVWKNGTVLSPITDYSLSGFAIHFTDELSTNDSLGIIYYTN